MEKTILDYFILIRKKLWAIALFVLLSCMITFVVSKVLIKPVYQADSQLLVNSVFKNSDSIQLNDVVMNLNLIDSYKEIIKSNAILDEVLANHPEFALTREKLDKKLKVSSIDKTNIITVEVEDNNYGKAVLIANEITQTFVKRIPDLMNMSNVKILTAADSGNLPPSGSAGLVMNLAISFVLSAMAALGVIFFLENINDTLRSAKEAEHYVGLPVLATIEPIKNNKARSRSKAASREVSDTKYATVK